jgi:hypothetical protein
MSVTDSGEPILLIHGVLVGDLLRSLVGVADTLARFLARHPMS